MASIAAAGDGWVSGGVIEQPRLKRSRVLMAGIALRGGRDMSCWFGQGIHCDVAPLWQVEQCGGERPLGAGMTHHCRHKIRGVLMAVSHCAVVGIWLADLAFTRRSRHGKYRSGRRRVG